MMKTMFGFFGAEAGATLTVVVAVTAPACASKRFLAAPSEQQAVSVVRSPVAPASAAACRVTGVVPSARDERLMSLVAATEASIAPSPTNAGDWIEPTFMFEKPRIREICIRYAAHTRREPRLPLPIQI